MRSLVPMLFMFALAGAAPESPPPGGWPIIARPVPMDAEHPDRDRVGALHWLGGWVLSSRDPRFGGISALTLDDRGRFLAIGDTGGVFRFRMARGRPAESSIATLPAGPGKTDGKNDRDAESMAFDPVSGSVWIGFEEHNAIWRYDRAMTRAEAHDEPPAMKDWPSNGGPEAMTRLPDGRFVVLAEEEKGPDGSTEGLLFLSDPAVPGGTPIRFGYRAPKGYVATDMAVLPDGRAVVVNRHYTPIDGVSAVLTLIDTRGIRAGAVLEGRELARLAPPITVDNMEALVVTRESGRTVLWIASDDNFNPLQRTLLLKFALDDSIAK
ncbi:esterase-like activity of phytase family protein [Flavisphingomonas formosensis]|uniref:esterase-like activity of phytase family protein n=1 Tax=Flavisphingomonas formosensis TaxID=861534 RepID=UPI0012F8B7D1|nr:esterase-like activity of phytase family protein [Sphingomonas formosensis]